MNFFSGLLNSLFERTSGLLERYQNGDNDLTNLCDALLSTKGEVSGIAISEQILSQYRGLNSEEKKAFFIYLLEEMDVDIAAISDSVNNYNKAKDPADYKAFINAAQPKRRAFFRRLNEAPGATFELVSMRRDLLELLADTPELAILDMDLRELFISWFNRGFLVLRPIDWTSPAHILEKIISYEAVHEIHSWEDLRRRLAPPDRRCFAFFHPSMPEEPLIFVEVALCAELPSSVQNILSDKRQPTAEKDMEFAVFYSISNCQQGLAGISFGHSLIKTVVGELSQEHPALKHFITLSPLPNFARWLGKQEIETEQGLQAASDFLTTEPDAARALGAAYLLQAKTKDGLLSDPVARFHLGNGASLYQIHEDADLSPRGKKQSFGLMVNYLYERDKLIENHEKFVRDGSINAHARLHDLARKYKDRLHEKHDQ